MKCPTKVTKRQVRGITLQRFLLQLAFMDGRVCLCGLDVSCHHVRVSLFVFALFQAAGAARKKADRCDKLSRPNKGKTLDGETSVNSDKAFACHWSRQIHSATAIVLYFSSRYDTDRKFRGRPRILSACSRSLWLYLSRVCNHVDRRFQSQVVQSVKS